MITIKTKEDIEKLKEGGKILAKVLKTIAKNIKPGVTGKELDDLAYKLIKEHNCEPAFLNYKADFMDNPYMATLCVSKNDVVVHGFPNSELVLSDGDIVSIDCGLIYKKLYTDSAITVPVGKVSREATKLMRVTNEALQKAIYECKAGNMLGDIGFAIQNHVEKNGFNVIRELVGHGVGFNLHESPEIFNFGTPHTGITLRPGMVIAIEPMATFSRTTVIQDKDESFKTENGEIAAHFEHTIAITVKGPIIITK